MSRVRRAAFDIEYEKANITENIKGSVKTISYTDVASGKTDSVSLALQDREKKWMGSWVAQEGDHLHAVMKFYDWEQDGDGWEIDCGLFEVDEVTVSGPPISCSITADSVPRSKAFNEEERTKNWEEITVREIAEEIAGRAGISLHYEAVDIPVRSLEQDKQTDCKFLYAVCEKYGLAMKVFAEKIVIFDEAVYESAPAVAELEYKDFEKYTCDSKVEGTYTGAKIAYLDPCTGESHIVMVGGGERIKEINEEADSAVDAQRKAVAALNNANKDAVTISGTVMARRELVASNCIEISGFGKWNGVYYIDQVTTKVGGNSASTQSFKAHKTGFRMDDAVVLIDAVPEVTEDVSDGEYTVAKGDTLMKIAEKTLGSPLRYAEIYDMNKEIIEEKAKAKGKKDSSNGHWIFQGTVLQIPGNANSGKLSIGRTADGKQRDKDWRSILY